MEKYQLGTVELVEGGATVVMACRDKIFDLLSIVKESRIGGQLQAANLEMPASLMDILAKWEQWNTILANVIVEVMSKDHAAFVLNEQNFQWLAPVANPRKIICIGTNYKDHIEEMGATILPPRPYSFLKPVTTLSGCGANVQLPPQAQKVDYEAELGVVIGKTIRHAKGQDALDCIAGYTVINDISARDWNREPSAVGIDWVMQKAYDGFLPTGPLVTPRQFVADPQNLPISLKVNGEKKQDSNTSKMLFSVQQIIEHLSSIMTLEPGDMIATGTPAGVAHGKKDPTYLKAGDVMEVEIEGLGKLTNKMVSQN